MSQPDKGEVIAFVKNNYGEKIKNKLENVHRGGNNNYKGRDYENQFLLYRVFEIAAKYPHNCENQIIETQAVSFVDDICHIDYEENTKYNYQAKNSSLASADWTQETSERFKLQREIDIALYGISRTKNTLLVSDPKKDLANQGKIPIELQGQDTSQYFKCHKNIYDLLMNTDLKQHISKLIDDTFSSRYDYAAVLIHGILQSGNYATINDIFCQAEFEGRPSPFIKFRKSEAQIPKWVMQILTKNSHYLSYGLNYDVLTVTVNQSFTATCNINSLNKVSSEVREEVQSIQDLIALFLSITGSDIEQSLKPSTKGEVK